MKLNRQDYLALMKSQVKNANLQKHMLAAEAILRELAPRFGGDSEEWGLAGLLHDIDYEQTADTPEQHGLLAAELLQEYNLPEHVIYAIKAHSGMLELKTDLDKALYAVDPLTGLIVAAALIHQDKKLASIDTQFVMNRFGVRSFARGANREQIKSCTSLGLDLEEFISIGLEAMQKISDELGL